jgi:tRNA-Thr(GGU) m(6)t(6)A37 methyltransferase TsaA
MNGAPAMRPIGIIHSCFKEKFGIPRQPGLVPDAEARLELLAPWNRDEAVRGLQDFSHIWVLFRFHQAPLERVKATVRPPRLGGNQRIGVFASRSPFRPNPLGLSAVTLRAVERTAHGLFLRLGGGDFLDGTPVLDIKPYIPYCDALPAARGGFADAPPQAQVEVSFGARAQQRLRQLPNAEGQLLERLIRQVLQHDPRPAYLTAQAAAKPYGVRLMTYNVRWTAQACQALVTEIENAE